MLVTGVLISSVRPNARRIAGRNVVSCQSLRRFVAAYRPAPAPEVRVNKQEVCARGRPADGERVRR